MTEFMIVDIDVSDVALRASAPTADPDELVGGLFNDVVSSGERPRYGNCRVTIYGRGMPTTAHPHGPSVAVHVTGFLPSLLLPVKYTKESIAKELRVPTDQVKMVPERASMLAPWNPDAATRRARIHDFNRVYVRTKRAWRDLTKFPGAVNASLDPTRQFLFATGLTACGWVKAKTGPTTHRCHADVEFECALGDVRAIERLEVAPLLIASFDLECVAPDFSFPKPERRDDAVVVFGISLWRHGTPWEWRERGALVTGPVDDIEGVRFIRFRSEAELLRGARDYLATTANPDVVLSYNALPSTSPSCGAGAQPSRCGELCVPVARTTRCVASRTTSRSKQQGAREMFLIESQGAFGWTFVPASRK